jgi:Fur family ferric uptake transcriptional regulator
MKSKAAQLLKSVSLRWTSHRVAIIEALLTADSTMTQGQIADALGPKAPNKTTIYRILERFCEQGIVHKAYVDKRAWAYELADKCTDHQCHPHFKCTNCGAVICLHDVHVPLVKSLGKDFIFQRQKIMIEGICPECSAGFCET